MSDQNDKVSYHIDAGGEIEISPRAYQETILQYRFGFTQEQLRSMTEQEVSRKFTELTEG